MSKKLKKKIEEICGLKDLDWEVRQDKANEILVSSEWKQSICNELIGLSFRDLEQVLAGIASERLKKEDSYERKLQAYSADKTARHPKPVQRDSSRPTSADSDRKSANKSRTLSEILAQVYAPRVVQTFPNKGISWLFQNRATDGSSDEIQQDSSDGDSSTEE